MCRRIKGRGRFKILIFLLLIIIYFVGKVSYIGHAQNTQNISKYDSVLRQTIVKCFESNIPFGAEITVSVTNKNSKLRENVYCKVYVDKINNKYFYEERIKDKYSCLLITGDTIYFKNNIYYKNKSNSFYYYMPIKKVKELTNSDFVINVLTLKSRKDFNQDLKNAILSEKAKFFDQIVVVGGKKLKTKNALITVSQSKMEACTKKFLKENIKKLFSVANIFGRLVGDSVNEVLGDKGDVTGSLDVVTDLLDLVSDDLLEMIPINPVKYNFYIDENDYKTKKIIITYNGNFTTLQITLDNIKFGKDVLFPNPPKEAFKKAEKISFKSYLNPIGFNIGYWDGAIPVYNYLIVNQMLAELDMNGSNFGY
ncbi:hypothetical protein ELD05_10475 [Caldicellulosiruptor changbaiensis]|uniref:Uncharacterized protein n=1 Tax=Caldicellulosiruptor changbaiensis TaxID=1222016 RepID=A0A3T0D7R7_9FIRM|nr:hypothetical protein [Caldicellulosiruptor changbaiensis]AZT91028.1 hypothetical protein ELD05_10475 [Caldicellulosiruptor changbaiensis]